MRPSFASLFVLSLAGLIAGSSLAKDAAATDADGKFVALYSDEWTWRQQQQGADGDDTPGKVRPNLPDVSPAAQARREAYWTRVLADLDAMDVKALTPQHQIDYDVYHAQIASLLANQKFHEWEKPLNADSFFWGEIAGVGRRPFKSEADYRNYLSQLSQVPRYFDEQIANMKAGLARGFTPPKVTMTGRDQSIAAVVAAKSPEDTNFYKAFKEMPAQIPVEIQVELRKQAVEVIKDKVLPAYQHLLRFMREDYLPHSRESLAAESLPDGKAYYQSKITEFATVTLTPEEIHQIGLSEVAKIHAEMLAVMKEVNFSGDLPAFLQFLRTDKQFYVTTPEALLERAAWIAKQFDGKAALYFGRMPRGRFTIVPVPPEIAPIYTAGRGGQGSYLVNTYDLPSRPLYALRALTLHESAPGHSWQGALAAENKDQPDFRRRVYISAFGEGWALYCEKLGVEMGMYETPYDRFGMLSYQMWRAARLVVDTGVHAKGWSREQAQAYLRDNTALSNHEIETEVDRYISWPGQALSYYLGELDILKNREKAEKALGHKFNIRAFHDAILALGSVPLAVIDQRIDRFIAEGGKGPYPDEE